MKYKIEYKLNPLWNRSQDLWKRSQDHAGEYTLEEAQRIVSHTAHPTRTNWRRYVPLRAEKPALRQVTREEFLDTLVDEAKERITFDRVHKYLPFAVKVVDGDTKHHIVNDSVYPVKTETRTVADGEPLCGRVGQLYRVNSGARQNCPGCLAIARGLAVRDLV
jgi:hypothetical protein